MPKTRFKGSAVCIVVSVSSTAAVALGGCSGAKGGSESVLPASAPNAAQRAQSESPQSQSSVGATGQIVGRSGADTVVGSATTKRGVAYIQAILRSPTAVVPQTPFSSKTVDECFNRSTAPCAVQGVASPSWGWEINCNGDALCTEDTFVFSLAPGAPDGVTATWSPSPVPPSTYSYSTLHATKQTPVGTKSLSYRYAVASGPGFSGTPPTLFPAPSQFLCGLALGTCPTVRIEDNNLNKVVSASPPPTTDTVVGEQEALIVQHAPGTGMAGTYSISRPAWTVDGTTYTAYGLDSSASPPPTAPKPVLTQSSDLQKESPTPFYWLAAGTYPVAVTARLSATDGNEIADLGARAQYNALAPTVVAIHGTPGAVYSTYTAQYVTLGINGPGMSFVFNATAPHGGTGLLAASQSVDTCATFTAKSGEVYYASSNTSVFHLDNTEFYPPSSPRFVGIFGGDPQFWNGSDNPRLKWPNTGPTSLLVKFSLKDSLVTTFLYQPRGIGDGVYHSIWVPLGQLRWGFDGSTVQTASGVWSKASGSITRESALGGTLPAWSGVVTNGQSAPKLLSTPNC